MRNQHTIADFTAERLDGEIVSLAEWLGKVVLVVNTASRCGFTPHYAGLEALWQRYGPRGLVVLAFPCDQFGHQEPGDAEEIARFCQVNFNISFPLMAKIAVNGPGALPLYQWLKAAAPGLFGSRAIKWNFTKFLIGRDGRVVRRYAPGVKPEKLAGAIEALL